MGIFLSVDPWMSSGEYQSVYQLWVTNDGITYSKGIFKTKYLVYFYFVTWMKNGHACANEYFNEEIDNFF